MAASGGDDIGASSATLCRPGAGADASKRCQLPGDFRRRRLTEADLGPEPLGGWPGPAHGPEPTGGGHALGGRGRTGPNRRAPARTGGPARDPARASGRFRSV